MSAVEHPLIVRLNAETFPMSAEERDILAQLGGRVVEIEGFREKETAAASRDADAVMITSTYLRAPVIAAMPRCRLISRIGTGTDKIDIDEATRRGILVTNVPDFSTDEVADHTLALLLAAARQLKVFEAAMRQGHQPRDVREMHRLSTRTLGLLGFGRIGRAVAQRAAAFGMRILAHDPCLAPEEVVAGGAAPADLDTLLAEADYLALMCPLLPSTRGMMTLREFRKMKPTAVLINTARGELVVEDDLVAALREGVIRYAAVDVYGGINVFGPDGFPTDHPFFGVENMLMTPHCAAASVEAMEDVARRAAAAVVDVLTGRWPRYPVNPEVAPWFDIARP
jgi:D-3-phosphoglycerate dehydrogenase